MKKISQRKQRLRSEKIQSSIAQVSMACCALVVPIACLLLYGLGVPIPTQAICIYWVIALMTVGILIIVFSKLGKFGFAKEGLWMRTFCWNSKHLSKEESKTVNYILGGILIGLAVLCTILGIAYHAT